MSSNGNIFHVTGPLCREFTGHSPHKCQWCGALIFSLICAWINSWVNNREVSDLRCHHVHYDVTIMISVLRKEWKCKYINLHFLNSINCEKDSFTIYKCISRHKHLLIYILANIIYGKTNFLFESIVKVKRGVVFVKKVTYSYHPWLTASMTLLSWQATLIYEPELSIHTIS